MKLRIHWFTAGVHACYIKPGYHSETEMNNCARLCAQFVNEKQKPSLIRAFACEYELYRVIREWWVKTFDFHRNAF